MEFEFLTFDCYGTLIDWESGIRNACKNIIRNKSIQVDLDSLPERYILAELEVEHEMYRKYKEILVITAIKLLKSLGIDALAEEAQAFADSIYSWPPFPETNPVLRSLKEKYKLVILSNIDDNIIEQSIKLIGIEFDGFITAEQVKSYKPSHKHWERMLQTFGVPMEKVLHIAASYVHDIVPAKEMGFKTVWINRHNERPKGPINPDYEFNSLKPLIDLLC